MEDVGNFEEAGDGVFLEVLDVALLVGQAVEDVLEGVDFQGREGFLSEASRLRSGSANLLSCGGFSWRGLMPTSS